MIAATSFDRVKSYLKRLIDQQTRRMDALALYPCKVVSQNGDGSLELQPDSQALAAVSRVPIRLGLPGATVKVSAGSRVLLGFEGGDLRYPVATLWGTSTLTELDIGNSPTSYIALATQTKAALDAIVTWANSHVHTGVTTGVGSSAVTASPLSTSTSVASSTVKST
jgi:hypothetical protein